MKRSVKSICQGQNNASCSSIRDQKVVQIRKAKREEYFKLRRKVCEQRKNNKILINNSSQKDGKKIFDPQFQTELIQFVQQDYTEQMLPYLSECLKSNNVIQIHRGIIGVRKILLKNPPINWIVNLKIDEKILQLPFLQYPHLQYQISWCLNILTFESTEIVDRYIQSGIVDILLKLLSSENTQTLQLVIFAISNVSNDSLKAKEQFLNKGYINYIDLYIFKRFIIDQRINQIGCFGIARFCLGQKLVRSQFIEAGVKKLAIMLQECCITQDLQIFLECTDAVFNYCQRIQQEEKYRQIISNELLGVVMQYLQHQDTIIAIQIARIIGNYIVKFEKATQSCISAGILRVIDNCLYSEQTIRKKNACWILANLAIQSPQQIIFFQQKDQGMKSILYRLAEMLFVETIEVQFEIFYILSAISKNRGNFLFQEFLKEQGLIDQMFQIIQQGLDKHVAIMMKSFYGMLLQAEKYNKQDIIVYQLHKERNLTILENLQVRESDLIYKYTSKILKKHFTCEEILIWNENL